MKKIFAILLAAVIFCLPVMAHIDGGLLGDVPSTTENITVDAVKDEIYNYGLKVEINNSLTGSEVKGTAVAYLLFKDSKIYVFAEVTDSDVVIPSESDQQSQPWVCDSLEVFINQNNSAESTDCVQYRIDNEGWPCAYDQNGLAAYGADAAAEYFSFAEVDTDAGYNVEYAIPVSVTTTGISFQLNDVSSDGSAQTWAMVHSDVTGEGPGSWNAEQYPYVTLGTTTAALPVAETEAPETEAPAADTTAPVTTPAAQTADIFAVAAVVAVISLAGVVIGKKR